MSYLDGLAAKIRDHVAAGTGIPDDSDHLFILYALLGRAKGQDVSAEDVHDAWVAWMQSRGEQHRSMVPFQNLDEATQRQDQPFVEAIRAALRNHGLSRPDA